jgi:predicted nucleotidyltransferase
LATVDGQIGAVKIYGSRATGRARPSSDLDLVVFPPASDSVIGELALAFEESDLPIFVDVLAWEHISNPVLRAEIERDAIPFE